MPDVIANALAGLISAFATGWLMYAAYKWGPTRHDNHKQEDTTDEP